MTNLFKNKKVLSCVLAFAVLAVSLFTGFAVSDIHAHADAEAEGTIDLLEFGDYLTEAGSTSKYWDTNVADNGETGDSWDNAIIIDNAEEFVYLCKASGNETAGKYYKVADGIAGFNLANANLDVEGTLAENLDVILSAGKNHAGGTPGFQGHFDGNGATVYGAWSNHTVVSNYAGLFTATFGDVTIKNIHVNKAHFTAKNAVGGIIGYHAATDMCTVTIENCSITDSYLETQGSGYGHAVGALLGFGASAPAKREANDQVDYNGDGDMVDTVYINVAYNIKNCYVNLDEANFVSAGEDGTVASGERVCHGGVAGVLGSNALKVSDCVVIGIKPYAVMEGNAANDVQHTGLESHFANVYTTSDVAITNVNLGGTGALATRNFTDKVFPLTDAQLKGAAVVDNMDLDWSVWMADNEGYPELANAHKNVTLVNKENGTHAATCACGFGGIAVPCTYVDGACECGAELTCDTRATIYWDGTKADGIATGTGTKADPYIIKTAAEFAWLIQQKADVTTGKYYEIDDTIGTIVLQPEAMADAIIALDSAAAVKTYFETNAASAKTWPFVGWEGSCFAGIFDGNGATVYGLYQVSTNNAGLFSTIDGGAAIKNIALKNSYLTSTATNYQVGGLAAVTSNAGYGAKTTGAIWFESCVVANNYMYNPSTSHDRTGAIIGASSDVVYIDNCLVDGNDVSYGDDSIPAGIWSSGNNSTIVSDSFVAPEGLVLDNDGAETPRYRNKVRNSIIIGVKPYDLGQGIGSRFNDPKCYTNVLTDADVATDTFGGTDKVLGATEEQIKTITSAADVLNANLGDAWIITSGGIDLKAFHDDVFTGTPSSEDAYAGHVAACSCGFGAGSVTAHVYNDAFTCEVCEFTCDHGEGSGYTKTPTAGDCITDTTYVGTCPCGYTDDGVETPKAGHSFTNVQEEPSADCQTHGVAAHKYCSVCDKKYAADADIYAAFDTALSDADLQLPVADHTPLMDGSNIIWSANDAGHSKTCSVCSQAFDTENHDGEYVANGAAGHAGECTVCGWETSADAGHNFGGDNTCDDCAWVCSAHNFVDGTVKAEGDCTTDRVVAQLCDICGIAGTDKVTTAPGHTNGDVVAENVVAAPNCLTGGSHDDVIYCTVCEAEVSRTPVADAAPGHEFVADGGCDATCTYEGLKAHKYCSACGNNFASDEENVLSTDYINDADLVIAVDPEAHVWEEIEAQAATCDEPGCVAFTLCQDCLLAIVDDEEIQIEIDIENINTEEELEAAVYAALDEAGILIPAAHKIVEVKEVAATTEKTGTKAHYACSECDKLFADAEGKNEVTAESLVIEKLAGGDNGTSSPVTGESVAVVAAFAALMGAAFVIIRKARKA